jgi:hypothetical protein
MVGSSECVGYLKPNLMSQSVINLVFKKCKSKKQDKEKQNQARDVVVCFRCTTMYAWRDKDCIMAPYNIE